MIDQHFPLSQIAINVKDIFQKAIFVKVNTTFIYEKCYIYNIFTTIYKWQVINGCYRDKGPKSYIGHWALFEDVEWFEEGQIVIRISN